MNKIKPYVVWLGNLIVILAFLYLPYYLFGGRLFLGGDDTRLYYAYPDSILRNLALFSWNNISSLPYYAPNHHWLPFVFTLSLIDSILKSKVILSYFLFSTILILGFVYFQKLAKELIGDDHIINFLSALIYILSPITLVGLSFFLSPVWLIAVVPIFSYYYLCYVRSGSMQYIVKIVLWSIFLSFAYFSIPWILGIFFPLLCGLILYIIFVENPFKKILQRTCIFIFFVASSQLFWLVPFTMSLIFGGQTGLGQKVVSQSLLESFRSTVMTTATDNIIYPILNLYHRELAFNFEWHLREVFLNFYDKTFILGFVFVIVLFLGFVKFNKVLDVRQKKIFIFLSASFLAALYFSTVNIGFLKDVFVLFVYIPGFAILRNFTDKFAFGFVFIYSLLLSISLYTIKKAYKFYGLLFIAVFVVVLINFLPVKEIIASPLWKTSDIYTSVTFPKEYIAFVTQAKQVLPNTVNVFALPQDIPAYSIITEDNKRNAYIGTSPFKFLTGINDLTGTGSYPINIGQDIQRMITTKDYKDLLVLLSQINTGYMMVTNNIPSEVKTSYLFDESYLKFQNKELINSIADHQILRSSKGNYLLYKLKNSPSIIYSKKNNIYYKKLSPVHYQITVKGLKGEQSLFFLETYHPGWNLYLKKLNAVGNINSDLFYYLKKPIFENTHKILLPYGNKWVMSSNVIKNGFNKSYYSKNVDGSINLTLDLYFSPQLYFYLGVFSTVLFLSMGFILLNKKNDKKKKK